MCVTDLPLHREGQPVVAEPSHSHRAAVLALPAFGGVRPERQAKELVVQLIAELLEPEETWSAPRPTAAVNTRTVRVDLPGSR